MAGVVVGDRGWMGEPTWCASSTSSYLLHLSDLSGEVWVGGWMDGWVSKKYVRCVVSGVSAGGRGRGRVRVRGRGRVEMLLLLLAAVQCSAEAGIFSD